MKVQPLYDRVVVQRIDADSTTGGGVIIPDTAKETPQEGRVIAAGPGRLLDDGRIVPLAIRRGDRVLFSKYAGSDFQLDGAVHTMLREADVLAILE